ncbi:hypothetical protein [Lawsonibacter sp.]|uniref:hypothetical protein n=1 Tax=Lawsonibacter sp. TaxID=2185275 RepID=UPI00258AD66D|nr:hypothetical protein [Lawsonibacter sp.]MCI6398461.1 hypothetical protein [Lawsonibacter sp.]MDY2976352.1 hypothetical protein [Oscillospiraceae bacterium]
MYNRYIPNGTAYTRVLEEDEPPRLLRPEPEPAAAAPSAPEPAQPEPAKKTGLAGLLKGLKLEELDTGDILLLLILLFLFLEGDDLELIITLGLLLLLGLE